MTLTNRKCAWSSVTQVFRNGLPSHDGNRQSFEVMTLT